MGAKLASRLAAENQASIWAGLCLLLLLGATTSVLDLLKLPAAESRRANAMQQRVIVDAVTGIVSGLKAAGAPEESAFDVAPEAPKKNAAPEEEAETKTQPAAKEPTPEQPIAAPALPDDLPKLRTDAVKANDDPVPMNKWSLTIAPAPEVSEKLSDGTLLPKRGENESSPFTIYAQPFTRAEKQSRLAIVILDAGLNPVATDMLLALPRQVSVAVSPYLQHGRDTIARLRNTGLETWAMLPTMSEHYPLDDPGPMGLIANLPADEINKRLHAIMSTTLGAPGFILPPDDGLGITKENFSPVLNELDARGFALLSTHPGHSLGQLTEDAKKRSMMRRADMILDDVANDAVIRSKLAGLATFAKDRTDTVVIAYARPQTLAILSEWLKENPLPEPLVLAPLSAIYAKDKPAQEKPAEAEGHGGGHGAAAAKPEKKEGKPAEGGHH